MGKIISDSSNVCYRPRNKNEATSAQQMWGGTGLIIQDKSVQRIVEFGEDSTNLARWSWCKLRGKEDTAAQIISIYVLNWTSHGLWTVVTQHQRYYPHIW